MVGAEENLEQSLLPTLMQVSREFARGLIGNEHRRECGHGTWTYVTLCYVQKYQGSDLSHLDARKNIRNRYEELQDWMSLYPQGTKGMSICTAYLIVGPNGNGNETVNDTGSVNQGVLSQRFVAPVISADGNFKKSNLFFDRLQICKKNVSFCIATLILFFDVGRFHDKGVLVLAYPSG
ncbi:hypothetical protein CBL_04743 [Carabus blaptoides fortunei]